MIDRVKVVMSGYRLLPWLYIQDHTAEILFPKVHRIKVIRYYFLNLWRRFYHTGTVDFDYTYHKRSDLRIAKHHVTKYGSFVFYAKARVDQWRCLSWSKYG